MNVTGVEPKGDKGAALLIMENGARVWTPEIEKAKALVGKPIPADWTQREGNYGPQAFPPDGKKGPATAYRNTKDGQAFEQQQMNRRTALMQAIALNSSQGKTRDYQQTIHEADAFFRWLESSPAAGTPATKTVPTAARQDAAPEPVAGGTSPTPPKAMGEVRGVGTTEGVSEATGEGVTGTPSTTCIHPEANRHKVASGGYRCGVCSEKVA